MLKRIFFLLLLFLYEGLNAQPTWNRRAEPMCFYGPYMHSDSIAGIVDLKIGKDGSAYALIFSNMDSREYLVKCSLDSGKILWNGGAGGHGGVTGSFAYHMFPTQDSGCVVADNFWDYTYPMYESKVNKYSKGGILEWSYELIHGNNSAIYELELMGVVQNSSGNIVALAGDGYNDSLFLLNPNGQLIYASGGIHANQMFSVGNGGLLMHTLQDSILLTDSSSAVYWSIPGNCIYVATDSFAITYYQNELRKIDCYTGQIIWAKILPFGISDVALASDGGLIGSAGLLHGYSDINRMPYYNGSLLIPGSLYRMDSFGNLIWSKHFQFPQFGLTCVTQALNGAILTGGTYLYSDNSPHWFNRYYSGFISALDSMGNGALDNTSVIWPGDANGNNYCSFVDDILYTGIALWNSGVPRDTTCIVADPQDIFAGTRSDFASDWTQTFASGANFKHADFNGDGHIDTSDIALYSKAWTMPFSIPSWRRGQFQNSGSFIPELKLSAVNDTVSPGDSAKYWIILGSNSIPVDTIYGVAFSVLYDFHVSGEDPACVETLDGQLGSIGVDLISSYYSETWAGPLFSTMWCRTDRQDRYHVLQDTLGILKIPIDSNLSSLSSLIMQIDEIKALKYNQDEVYLNVVADTIQFLYPGVEVNDIFQNYFHVSPNPANTNIRISDFPAAEKNIQIELRTIVGEKLLSMDYSMLNSSNSINIDVSKYSEGVYFLKIFNSSQNCSRKIVITH